MLFTKILWVTSLLVIDEVWCCSTDSFGNIDVGVYYVRRSWESTVKARRCFSQATLAETKATGAVTRIKVHDYEIPILKRTAATSLPQLYAMELQQNRIQEIEGNALKSLLKLKFLYLNKNEIDNIHDNAFTHLPALEYLYLQDNKLQAFKQECLSNTPKLTVLYLTNNLIVSIPANSFNRLTKLAGIHLAHNRIAYIDVKAFNGLQELYFLDLSYNQISQLSNEVFTPVSSSLIILNLYGNHLTYISDAVLASMTAIKELIVLYNPITCACLTKLLEWAENMEVSIANTELKCNKTVSPDSFQVCIPTEEAYCIPKASDQLLQILQEEQSDFECYRRMGAIKPNNCC